MPDAKTDTMPRSSMSVSSTITTASAPSGIGAPVAISAHSPAPTRRCATCPVKIVSIRRNVRGVARLAPVVSSALTRVAIHRRSRERWHVGRRDEVLCEHAAVGLQEWIRPQCGRSARTARSMIARASSSAMVFPNGLIFDGTDSTPNHQLPTPKAPTPEKA